MRSSPFITPAQPTLRDRPPKGEAWLHEVKFDGYRVQLHKAGKDVVIFSRNGADFTSRWPAIAYALQPLPARTAIIDAAAAELPKQRGTRERGLVPPIETALKLSALAGGLASSKGAPF